MAQPTRCTFLTSTLQNLQLDCHEWSGGAGSCSRLGSPSRGRRLRSLLLCAAQIGAACSGAALVVSRSSIKLSKPLARTPWAALPVLASPIVPPEVQLRSRRILVQGRLVLRIYSAAICVTLVLNDRATNSLCSSLCQLTPCQWILVLSVVRGRKPRCSIISIALCGLCSFNQLRRAW